MKLSKTMREVVTIAAVKKAYDTKIDEAKKTLDQAVFEWLISQGEKLARDIPAGFEKYINTTSSWKIYCQHKQSAYGNLPEQICNERNHSIMGHDEAMKQLPAYAAMDALIDERDEFQEAVKAVVNSCSTAKQLGDIAPELAQLLPEPPENVGGALVAIETVAKVRAMLG